MAPFSAYATLSTPLPNGPTGRRPYIVAIHPSPSPTTPHLLLRHPETDISICDNQSLESVGSFSGAHSAAVTDIAIGEEGGVWSSSKDASVVRWDERSRRAAMNIKAFIRKPLPVLALAVAERDNLVVGGTELLSSEAHIIFWDVRNPSSPAYVHSSTHSDDITHLSLLPASTSFLRGSAVQPLPERLLLSTSTDGLVALSNYKETDEDEAVVAAENWGQSVAAAGSYMHKGKMRVWARSDMDAVALWDIQRGEEDEIQLGGFEEHGTDLFKFREFALANEGPRTTMTAQEEREGKQNKLKSDYLADVCPNLGVSRGGQPICAVGSNEGDLVLLHHEASSSKTPYQPSAYFRTGPTEHRGHKDVIRAIFHDTANEALYTGSEDGVLSGWSLASLPRLRTGDPDIDDVDEEDERKELEEAESEESEIESSEEDDEDDEMDVDEDDEEDEGPRHGPVLGLGRREDERKEKRRAKRQNPY